MASTGASNGGVQRHTPGELPGPSKKDHQHGLVGKAFSSGAHAVGSLGQTGVQAVGTLGHTVGDVGKSVGGTVTGFAPDLHSQRGGASPQRNPASSAEVTQRPQPPRLAPRRSGAMNAPQGYIAPQPRESYFLYIGIALVLLTLLVRFPVWLLVTGAIVGGLYYWVITH